MNTSSTNDQQWLIDARPNTYLLTVDPDDLEGHLSPVWKWRIEHEHRAAALIGWTSPAWADHVLEDGEPHQYVTGTEATVWADQHQTLAESRVKAAIRRAVSAGATYEVGNLMVSTNATEVLAQITAGGGRWVCPNMHCTVLAEEVEELFDRLQGGLTLDAETVRRIDRDPTSRSVTAPESPGAATGVA